MGSKRLKACSKQFSSFGMMHDDACCCSDEFARQYDSCSGEFIVQIVCSAELIVQIVRSGKFIIQIVRSGESSVQIVRLLDSTELFYLPTACKVVP